MKGSEEMSDEQKKKDEEAKKQEAKKKAGLDNAGKFTWDIGDIVFLDKDGNPIEEEEKK